MKRARRGRGAANVYLTGMLTGLHSHLQRTRRLARSRPERLRGTTLQRVQTARATAAGNGTEAVRIGIQRLRESLQAIIDILAR
jgi:hypothetical protein